MRWVVEEGRSPNQAVAKARFLSAAGFAAHVDGQPLANVWIELPADSRLPERLAAFLHCHQLVLQAARAQGLGIEPYKPLDKAEIVVALQRAEGTMGDWRLDAARLWHELVWAQGLPNTNHRSALLYVERQANLPGQPERLASPANLAWAERLVQASKPLILDKEFTPDQELAKERHWVMTRNHFLEL